MASNDNARPLPRSLLWTRTDVAGSEHVVFDDGPPLHARGWQHAIDPEPYALMYELETDAGGATSRLLAHAEGAGWTRDLILERDAAGWSCTIAASGRSDLAAFDGAAVRLPAPPGFADEAALQQAVDVDIGGSPLTNSLPVRRLALLRADAGTVVELVSAWVLPPTLEVIASRQSYTVLDGNRIRFGDDGTAAAVEYDSEGWVVDYPGLARRAVAAPGR